MITGSVTIEEVVDVFRALGGEAPRKSFLRKLSEGRDYPNQAYEPYATVTYFETTAWQVVQRRCHGYKRYTGENALFKRVGSAKCRLLEINQRNSVSSEAEPSSEKIFQFSPKPWSALSASALVQLVETQRTMILEHNSMQGALYQRLLREFDENQLHCENFTCLGTW
jgi:hypothetical protein